MDKNKYYKINPQQSYLPQEENDEDAFIESHYRGEVVGRRGGNENKKNNYNERVRDQLQVRNNPTQSRMKDERVPSNVPMKMSGSAVSNAQMIEKERSRGIEIDRNQQSLLKNKETQFFEFNTRDYDDEDEFEVLQVEEEEYKNYNFKKNSDDLMIERSRFN
jgi:hypothetical protein